MADTDGEAHGLDGQAGAPLHAEDGAPLHTARTLATWHETLFTLQMFEQLLYGSFFCASLAPTKPANVRHTFRFQKGTSTWSSVCKSFSTVLAPKAVLRIIAAFDGCQYPEYQAGGTVLQVMALTMKALQRLGRSGERQSSKTVCSSISCTTHLVPLSWVTRSGPSLRGRHMARCVSCAGDRDQPPQKGQKRLPVEQVSVCWSSVCTPCYL